LDGPFQSTDISCLDFNHPKGGILGLLSTINTIGFITALPFTGWIADFLGRKRPVQIGSVIMIIGAVIQSSAMNIGMFIAARFLLGFGLSIACVAAPALVAELTYPSHRGKMTALYNTNWFVGAIIAGQSQHHYCFQRHANMSNQHGVLLARSVSTTLGRGDCLHCYNVCLRLFN
jgi:MFS family permease